MALKKELKTKAEYEAAGLGHLWNPNKHPRGHHGEFEHTGSTTPKGKVAPQGWQLASPGFKPKQFGQLPVPAKTLGAKLHADKQAGKHANDYEYWLAAQKLASQHNKAHPNDKVTPNHVKNAAMQHEIQDKGKFSFIGDGPKAEAAPVEPKSHDHGSTPGGVKLKSKFKAPGQIYPTGKTMAGVSGAQVYEDKDGGKWLVKVPGGINGNSKAYSNNKFLVDLDVATSRIQHLAGLPTPSINAVNLPNGKQASVHKMYSRVEDMYPSEFDINKLSSDDLLQIQRSMVLDWLISNNDAHSGNFLRTDKGVIGIDKGQAFKYFGKDKLSPNFGSDVNPPLSPNVPVYSHLMHQEIDYGGGYMHNFNEGELHTEIERIQNIPDDKYKDLLRPYAIQAAAMGLLNYPGKKYGETPNVEKFLAAAVERKNNLAKDFADLQSQLENNKPGFDDTHTHPQKKLPKKAGPKPSSLEELSPKGMGKYEGSPAAIFEGWHMGAYSLDQMKQMVHEGKVSQDDVDSAYSKGHLTLDVAQQLDKVIEDKKDVKAKQLRAAKKPSNKLIDKISIGDELDLHGVVDDNGDPDYDDPMIINEVTKDGSGQVISVGGYYQNAGPDDHFTLSSDELEADPWYISKKGLASKAKDALKPPVDKEVVKPKISVTSDDDKYYMHDHNKSMEQNLQDASDHAVEFNKLATGYEIVPHPTQDGAFTIQKPNKGEFSKNPAGEVKSWPSAEDALNSSTMAKYKTQQDAAQVAKEQQLKQEMGLAQHTALNSDYLDVSNPLAGMTPEDVADFNSLKDTVAAGNHTPDDYMKFKKLKQKVADSKKAAGAASIVDESDDGGGFDAPAESVAASGKGAKKQPPKATQGKGSIPTLESLKTKGPNTIEDGQKLWDMKQNGDFPDYHQMWLAAQKLSGQYQKKAQTANPGKKLVSGEDYASPNQIRWAALRLEYDQTGVVTWETKEEKTSQVIEHKAPTASAGKKTAALHNHVPVVARTNSTHDLPTSAADGKGAAGTFNNPHVFNSGYGSDELQKYGRKYTSTTGWNSTQQSAIRGYSTSSGANAINNWLRSGNVPQYGGGDAGSIAAKVKAIDAGFQAPQVKPLEDWTIVTRGTNGGWELGLGTDSPDFDDIQKMVGKTVQNKSFISTSLDKQSAFGGSMKIIYKLPPGFKGIFMGNSSTLTQHSSEREMMLPRNLQYKILEAKKDGNKTVVTVEVTGQGKL